MGCALPRAGLALFVLALTPVGCDAHRAPTADVVAAVPPPEPRAEPVLSAWGTPFRSPPAEHAPGLRAAEARRDPNDAMLTQLPDEPRAALATLIAIGRIGGADALGRILPILDGDRGAAVGAGSLATPGLLLAGEGAPWEGLESLLWRRYAVTEAPAEAEALLFSIARVGGSRSIDLLAADLGLGDASPRAQAAATAAGILCSRGEPLTREAADALAAALSSPTLELVRAASWALGRCVPRSQELFAGPERRSLVERLAPLIAGDPESARLAWIVHHALGELPATIPAAVLDAAGTLPWALETQAVRALAARAEGRKLLVSRLATLPVPGRDSPRAHVVIQALHDLRVAVAEEPGLDAGLAGLRRRLAAEAPTDARHGRTLAVLACELAVLDAVADGRTDAIAGCDEDGRLSSTHAVLLEVEALAVASPRNPNGRARRLLERARDEAPAIAEAALSALVELDDSATLRATLRHALAHPDLGVVAAAAATIGSRARDSDGRDETAVPALRRLVAERIEPAWLEARLAAIEALGVLGRTAITTDNGAPPWLVEAIVPLLADGHVAVRTAARHALAGHPRLLAAAGDPTPALAALPDHVRLALEDPRPTPRGMVVHTTAGTLHVDFAGAPAPIAQRSLAALAETGFYDGSRLHRVVADFVVQGGDPRGDGYGGPGWVLPCEWSNLRFERGTVGIALAGKDTGGSQFFVTHSAQPHLDGRFTVIGRVDQGLDVLDRILAHDRIESIEVVRGEVP